MECAKLKRSQPCCGNLELVELIAIAAASEATTASLLHNLALDAQRSGSVAGLAAHRPPQPVVGPMLLHMPLCESMVPTTLDHRELGETNLGNPLCSCRLRESG